MAKTCIQHLAPANKPPFHDTRYCRCLMKAQPVLAEHKIGSRARWQAEFIDERIALLGAWAANRKE